ncbi:MAG TPA: methyltransferase domain-containing protein [Candidatus Limnocylindria bacterium]
MGHLDVPAGRQDREGPRGQCRHPRLRPQAGADRHRSIDHTDHVGLIRDAVAPGETWLELGSGTGAFTLALADLVGSRGMIHSIDQDRGALASQAAAVRAQFGAVRLDQRSADFTRPLGFSGMDGVLMANSLHFVRDKAPVLALVRSYLAPGGRFVLVEYDADRGNHWVPHPISYTTWLAVAPAAGFNGARLLGRVPSRFLNAIYASVATV